VRRASAAHAPREISAFVIARGASHNARAIDGIPLLIADCFEQGFRKNTTMTIAHVALAVLIFFTCEAVLLTALWKRARHQTFGVGAAIVAAATSREIIKPASRPN